MISPVACRVHLIDLPSEEDPDAPTIGEGGVLREQAAADASPALIGRTWELTGGGVSRSVSDAAAGVSLAPRSAPRSGKMGWGGVPRATCRLVRLECDDIQPRAEFYGSGGNG